MAEAVLPSTLGLDIAMVGVDGAGKSTLSRALAGHLSAQGHAVTEQSWQRQLTPEPATFEQQIFSDLYVRLVEALYHDAVLADGGPVASLLPTTPQGYFAPDQIKLFDSLQIGSNDALSITAAGFIDLAGTLLFQELVVKPAILRGEVVVQDSHGLKSLLKFAALADSADPGLGAGKTLLDALHSGLLERMMPDICVLVLGDPESAMRQRIAQKGRLGAMEHYGLAGRAAADTFVEFQHDLQEGLLSLAREHGWLCVSMTGRPLSAALEHGVAAIVDDPRLVKWSSERSVRTKARM